jgi:serralysin
MLHDLEWNVDASAATANLTVFGAGGDDVFLLGSGDDRFYAGGGNDQVSLGAGDDEAVAYNYFSYDGHLGTTKIDGGAGFDWMTFENGQGTDVYPVLTTGVDIVLGKPVRVANYKISFSNFEGVKGTSKADTFVGSNNANYYVANGGGDLITGRAGGDTLVGGAGEDAFIYHKVSDSAGKHIDRIGQFQHDVDYFDLSALTPDTKNGRFRFVGYDDLQKAGDLHYIAHNERGFDHDYTMIAANIDDKGGPDFKIKIIGVVDLGPGDFIL